MAQEPTECIPKNLTSYDTSCDIVTCMSQIDKKVLIQKYIKERKSMAQIAIEIGSSSTSVKRYLDKFNIQTRPSPANSSLFDLTGQTFGNLLVLKKLGSKLRVKSNKSSLTSIYLCKCRCGNLIDVFRNKLVYNKKKSCGCLYFTYWKGYEAISGTYWGHIKNMAKKRNLKFEISLEYVWNLFIKQNSKCILSGLDLCFAPQGVQQSNIQTASLDRIDSSKGYVKDNVQWVHKRINIMKNNMKDEDFILLCKKVAELPK